jgi:transposase
MRFILGVFAPAFSAMLQLITILNRCHHFRGFVYQHACFSSDHKSIEIAVRPRKGSAAVCSRCHQPAPGYDQLAERRYDFIPFWGFLVFLLYAMRRVDCRRCQAVVVEEVPWGNGKHQLTNAYMLFLARWARRLSWKETAEAFRTSWDKVCDAVEHVVTFGLEHRTLGQIDAIGVDEIQYAKGHKYLTLVYQIDLGVTRLLWVGKERTIESFQGFFTTIGEEITSKIVFVCSDMWEPYLKVIREKCSQALHILDRFHIVAKMNKALDEVRGGESRRMASEGQTPLLKKSRWLLLKREENLKTEQRFRLRDLLRYNLGTVRAYLLKEAFQQLWDYNSPAWAAKFLDEWCRQTMRSRIEPMKKIARSLRQHRELILNYFRAQKLLSSGVVEGLNNNANVTRRKSYGFRTFRILELALYHSLGKLPEPEATHDFF